MAYNRTYFYNCVSQSGIKYRVEFYDQIASSTFHDRRGQPGPNPVKIKWGSDGSKMFAPFKPSTLTLNFTVTDFTAANYMHRIRTSYQEQDIYVAVYRENVGGAASPQYSPLWGGFLLPDLSNDPDISIPWNVTLRAIDGISALKYYDYIPEDTPQAADNLYDIADTWMPDGVGNGQATWRTFKQVIADCFLYIGEFTTAKGNAGSNPTFRTAVRWFNGEMANTTDDPLAKSRVKPNIFYKEEELTDDITKYKPMTCYEVLKSICEGWGMRLFYWRNVYYFIQLNQWEINQQGDNLSPEDIRNWQYNMQGGSASAKDSVQGYWGTYQLYLDNKSLSKSIKWNKKAGGQYGILPAFKKVTVDFLNVDNVNRFTEFPPIPLTSSIGAPSSAGSSNFAEAYEFRSLGVFTFDGLTDQSFFQRIYLDINNTTTTTGHITVTWVLCAREAGTGTNTLNTHPNNNGWTHFNVPNPTASNGFAQEWHGNFYLSWFGFPYDSEFWVNQGMNTIQITDDPAFSTIPQIVVCPAANFASGDWELAYYVESSYTEGTQSGTNDNWWRCGRWRPSGGSYGGHGTNPWNYGISWQNVQASQGIGASEFAPIINGAVGSAMTTTSLVQTGDDTANQKISNILFGDTGNNQSEGCVQIYDGTVWIPSDFSGVWGQGTLSGGNSLAQQLATDIIQKQANPIHKFTVTTLLNPERGVYYNDLTANRPLYPWPGTKWNTLSHAASSTFARSWLMHTAEFNIVEDEWKWVLYEQKKFAVSTTTTTTTTGGWNTGNTGGWDIPHDDDDIIMAKIGNPEGNNRANIKRLQQNAQKELATISTAQRMTLWDGTGEEPAQPSQTITSLDVIAMPEAILKTGDKIYVHCSTYKRLTEAQQTEANINLNRRIIEFEVSEDQEVDATSISVTSQTIYQDINKGDIISFSLAQLLQQSNDKTRGTVAGFTVDSNGLTKDGIEITGWLDSDTMEGASANKVATSESTKAYVDTTVATKQNTITLTTEGTSGAATLSDDTLNIPQYSGGGGSVTSNYKCFKCEATITTSGDPGTLSTIPFDTLAAGSTESSITLYDNEGPSGLTGGAYSFSMEAGDYQLIWNVGTNTSGTNNRILTGVKLQKGTVEGETIGWADVDLSYSYIYDRGNGSIRKGSTHNSFLLRVTTPEGEHPNYYRLVIWKEAASNEATNSVTLLNATSITIIEQQ